MVGVIKLRNRSSVKDYSQYLHKIATGLFGTRNISQEILSDGEGKGRTGNARILYVPILERNKIMSSWFNG